MDQYPIYSQRDPRWASVHYGLPQASQMSTIGMYGCAITAVAQLLTLNGMAITPLEVQDIFAQVGCYKRFGTFNLVDWARVPLAFPHLHYNGREDRASGPVQKPIMRRVHSWLMAGWQVVVYVDANKYALGLQQHFVLAIGYDDRERITVLNPWNGKRQDLSAYDTPDEMAIRGMIFMDVLHAAAS